MGYVEPNSSRWLSLEDLPNENWKYIEGYEGLYQISNYGRIKNSKRVGSQGKQRILKVSVSKVGYCSVGLCINGKVKWFRINRLVATHFVPNVDNKSDVNHNDENKLNNYYKNLTWMTSKENANYGTRCKRIAEKTRIKICQYDINMRFMREWSSLTQASKHLGIPISHISQVCRGERKTCGGYVWRYRKDVKNGLALQ